MRGRDYTSVGDTSADSASGGRTGVVLGAGVGSGVQDVGASDAVEVGTTVGEKDPVKEPSLTVKESTLTEEMKESTLTELGTKKEEILQGLAGRGISLSPQDGVVKDEGLDVPDLPVPRTQNPLPQTLPSQRFTLNHNPHTKP